MIEIEIEIDSSIDSSIRPFVLFLNCVVYLFSNLRLPVRSVRYIVAAAM